MIPTFPVRSGTWDALSHPPFPLFMIVDHRNFSIGLGGVMVTYNPKSQGFPSVQSPKQNEW